MFSSTQIIKRFRLNQEQKKECEKLQRETNQESKLIQQKLREELKKACLESGKDASVKELMECIDFEDKYYGWKNEILLYACYGGCLPVFEKLLNYVKFEDFQSEEIYDEPKSQGVLNLQHGLGDPMHAAMLGDQPAILELLIEKIAAPIEKQIANLTLNVMATKLKMNLQCRPIREVAEQTLKEVHEDKDLPKKIVIDIIRRENGVEIPRFLESRKMILHKDDSFSQRQPLLIEAGILGSIECVKMLVNKYKASPNTPYFEPHHRSFDRYVKFGDALTATIEAGQNDVALFLISQGALQNSNYNNIKTAVDSNNLLMVKILLEQDPHVVDHVSKVKLFENTNPDIKKLIEDQQNEIKFEKERHETIHKKVTETAGWLENALQRRPHTEIADTQVEERDDHIEIQFTLKSSRYK